MNYNLKEADVKKKYPNAPLHDITKNKICLSSGQLEMILKTTRENKSFGQWFLVICKDQLTFKKGKSLDFYDLTNIIDLCFQKHNKKVSFSSDETLKEFSSQEEILLIKKNINDLDQRLKALEMKQKDMNEQHEFTFVIHDPDCSNKGK